MSLVKNCEECGRPILLVQDRMDRWFAMEMQVKAYGVAPHGRLGAEKKTMILHDYVCPVKVLKRSQEPQSPAQQELIQDQSDSERYP